MHKTYLMIHIWEFVWSASVYMSIAWRQKYPWSLLRISSDHLIMSRRCFSLYSPDVSRASKSKPFSSAYRFFIGPERRKILDSDTFFASHSVKWSFPDFRLPENRSTHAGLLLADVWDIVISYLCLPTRLITHELYQECQSQEMQTISSTSAQYHFVWIFLFSCGLRCMKP